MRFEHLIQINDAGNPLVTPMTREQLWRGLLARVRTPQRFPLGPDRCELSGAAASDEEATLMQRQVHFGALVIDDMVRLEPGRGVHFEPQARDGMPSVTLGITIEEPRAGALFLRFVYASPEAPGSAALDLQVQRLREQAWLANDLDMVRTLREWQHDGQL